MNMQEVIEQARKPVNDIPAAATNAAAANENAPVTNTAQLAFQQGSTANMNFPGDAAKLHLENAGTLYAKAAACFAERYQLEVLEHAMGCQQR